jgi:hypothetical protein
MQQLGARGISLSFDEANTLRRAELTLQRWGEMECGDSGPFASWAIERDEQTGVPYRAVYPHKGERAPYRTRIADREAGALRRVKAICQAHGLHFYHQTDPRGCALYVSNEPLPDHNYTRGVACCA